MRNPFRRKSGFDRALEKEFGRSYKTMRTVQTAKGPVRIEVLAFEGKPIKVWPPMTMAELRKEGKRRDAARFRESKGVLE